MIGIFGKLGILGCFLIVGSMGCSTVTVEYHAIGEDPPICKNGLPLKKVAVFWGVAWRVDQKEASIRKEMIEDTINDFFGSNRCFETMAIKNSLADKSPLLAADPELTSEGKKVGANTVVLIGVEELGPNVILYLSPILWETKNEVRFTMRIIDIETERLKSIVTTQWIRGGPFTFNGAGSLPRDFQGALRAVFFGSDPP